MAYPTFSGLTKHEDKKGTKWLLQWIARPPPPAIYTNLPVPQKAAVGMPKW